MLRGLAACLFLLFALAPGVDVRAEGEALHERIERAVQLRRAPARARREAAPTGPSLRRRSDPPRPVADEVGPRTARRTVRPPGAA